MPPAKTALQPVSRTHPARYKWAARHPYRVDRLIKAHRGCPLKRCHVRDGFAQQQRKNQPLHKPVPHLGRTERSQRRHRRDQQSEHSASGKAQQQCPPVTQQPAEQPRSVQRSCSMRHHKSQRQPAQALLARPDIKRLIRRVSKHRNEQHTMRQHR